MKNFDTSELKNIQKIGVIMWGLIGDVLIRTPVVKVLKELYPEADIVAIVDPIGKGIVENNRYVDDVLVSHRSADKKWKKQFYKIKNIIDIRKQKFDLLVNLYNGGSSPFVVLCSGARYKLGFCHQKSWHKYVYNVKNHCANDRLKTKQSLYNYMISIVEPFFEKNYQFNLQPVFDIPEEVFVAQKVYLQKKVKDIDNLYVLNLGTSDTKKMLPNDKMFTLVKYIYDTYAYMPLLVKNPGQEYLQTEFIENYLKPNAIPYVALEVMNFAEIASIIKLTKFIVTHDTRLMHLAMALDTYILTIFTYTHPIFVDPSSDKFIALYEKFSGEELYKNQNISQKRIIEVVHTLFSQLKS